MDEKEMQALQHAMAACLNAMRQATAANRAASDVIFALAETHPDREAFFVSFERAKERAITQELFSPVGDDALREYDEHRRRWLAALGKMAPPSAIPGH